jgi:hypothetical protein
MSNYDNLAPPEQHFLPIALAQSMLEDPVLSQYSICTSLEDCRDLCIGVFAISPVDARLDRDITVYFFEDLITVRAWARNSNYKHGGDGDIGEMWLEAADLVDIKYGEIINPDYDPQETINTITGTIKENLWRLKIE